MAKTRISIHIVPVGAHEGHEFWPLFFGYAYGLRASRAREGVGSEKMRHPCEFRRTLTTGRRDVASRASPRGAARLDVLGRLRSLCVSWPIEVGPQSAKRAFLGRKGRAPIGLRICRHFVSLRVHGMPVKLWAGWTVNSNHHSPVGLQGPKCSSTKASALFVKRLIQFFIG